MFGFKSFTEILEDYVPVIFLGLIIFGIVYALKKSGAIKTKISETLYTQKELENERRLKEVMEIREKAKQKTYDKFISCVKNNVNTELWDQYWKDKIKSSDKRMKKEEWLKKYTDVIEEVLQSNYKKEKVYFTYVNEELDFFDYQITLVSEKYNSYDEWKKEFQLNYVVFTMIDKHFEKEEINHSYIASDIPSSSSFSSYSSTPSRSYTYDYTEQERRDAERLERKLDYQTPSMEDRKYGAVRKDRYGNLYTAGGTVIDKTAIELKKIEKQRKFEESLKKAEERRLRNQEYYWGKKH